MLTWNEGYDKHQQCLAHGHGNQKTTFTELPKKINGNREPALCGVKFFGKAPTVPFSNLQLGPEKPWRTFWRG